MVSNVTQLAKVRAATAWNTFSCSGEGGYMERMKPYDDHMITQVATGLFGVREETIQRASGALDVLKNARIVATLDEALDGMSHLCATAMTPRDFGPPTVTPREHFEALAKKETLMSAGQSSLANSEQGMAFLFGCERFGMSNEDVYRCHAALCIPSDPKFGSLNLGAALQVIAYEWRLTLGA